MNKKNFVNITLKDFSPKSTQKEKNVFFETDEQIKIKSNYYSKDFSKIKVSESIAGLPPFVRGPYSSMYTKNHGQLDNMQVFLQQKKVINFIEKI